MLSRLLSNVALSCVPHSSGDLFQCRCYWTNSLGLVESWDVWSSPIVEPGVALGDMWGDIGCRSGNQSPASAEGWLYISFKKRKVKTPHFEISLNWQKSGKITFLYAFYILRSYDIIHWEVSNLPVSQFFSNFLWPWHFWKRIIL